MPSKKTLKAELETAAVGKSVTVTITGDLNNLSVSIDDVLVPRAPGSKSGTWLGKRGALGPGKHIVKWLVEGAPGTAYTIALSGDTTPWSYPGKTLESGKYKGADLGSKPFTVNS